MEHGAQESRRFRAERRRARRLYIIRPELLPNPRINTPWQALYHSQSDRAFITTMGFDVAAFNAILRDGFEDAWNTTPIPRSDVPSTAVPRLTCRSLDAAGALGLILHYLNSTILDVSLVEIFALIPTTVSRYISFAMDILLATLERMPAAQIKWLKDGQFELNNNLILARHPLLDGAFGSVDGLKLPVQVSIDQEIENATYNGWLHDHFISNILAFSAQGEIIAARINAPGSWHDSRVARPIYEKLLNDTPDGFYLVADTAFPQGTDAIHGKIKASIKQGTRLPRDACERDAMMAFDRQLLSYRQTAEWGMRTMQGSFGRLRVPLPIRYGPIRKTLLEVCMRLFNLRARTVGHNQIRTVYMPIWRHDEEQERLWQRFEDVLFSDQQRNDRVARFHNSIFVEE
ncbi:hypothetical protein BDZ89DRAFT_945205 [Hymenopellis radicata]|nr:hypothetical protein BDZ89DRAFT_945205 [Hymenopellis radicata]